jgi:hypothetical protein
MFTAVLIGRDPATLPLPPHMGSYTRALLVSQDKRHLFVTPWCLLNRRHCNPPAATHEKSQASTCEDPVYVSAPAVTLADRTAPTRRNLQIKSLKEAKLAEISAALLKMGDI